MYADVYIHIYVAAPRQRRSAPRSPVASTASKPSREQQRRRLQGSDSCTILHDGMFYKFLPHYILYYIILCYSIGMLYFIIFGLLRVGFNSAVFWVFLQGSIDFSCMRCGANLRSKLLSGLGSSFDQCPYVGGLCRFVHSFALKVS